MPNEPEARGCFQRQVSLKGVLAGVWESSEDGFASRLGDPHELGADPGISGWQRGRGGAGSGAQAGPCVHRPGAATVFVLAAGQAGLGKGLLQRYLAEGQLGDGRRGAGRPFRHKYRREDILLLAATDELHGRLSGLATLAICKRASEVFGDERFRRLAGLSNGHLYNLRRSPAYVREMGVRDSTRPARVTIA